jgi:hypothetical protein
MLHRQSELRTLSGRARWAFRWFCGFVDPWKCWSVTDAPSQDRLQILERRFHAAIRDADYEALEQLLEDRFTAGEWSGEQGISRREFLRRAIYSEVVVPSVEPRWVPVNDETPAGNISYRWTSQDGVSHTRGSMWRETEGGLRLRNHLAIVGAFNGGEPRK